MHPVSISIEKTYQWADGVIDWPLLKTKGLLVIEEMLAPGCGEQLHYHDKMKQSFNMLARRAVMRGADGQNVEIDTGMALHISPETHYKIVNQTDEETCFLVISASSSCGDRHEVEQEK